MEGTITDLADGSITVQSHNASPVTCAVPPGINLSGFSPQDRVEMKCRMVDGRLTLVKLETTSDGDDDGGGDGDG